MRQVVEISRSNLFADIHQHLNVVGPLGTGHLDPDRHGQVPRANCETDKGHQRHPALSRGPTDALVQHCGAAEVGWWQEHEWS